MIQRQSQGAKEIKKIKKWTAYVEGAERERGSLFSLFLGENDSERLETEEGGVGGA